MIFNRHRKNLRRCSTPSKVKRWSWWKRHPWKLILEIRSKIPIKTRRNLRYNFHQQRIKPRNLRWTVINWDWSRSRWNPSRQNSRTNSRESQTRRRKLSDRWRRLQRSTLDKSISFNLISPRSQTNTNLKLLNLPRTCNCSRMKSRLISMTSKTEKQWNKSWDLSWSKVQRRRSNHRQSLNQLWPRKSNN
jgi:hypothetical protein